MTDTLMHLSRGLHACRGRQTGASSCVTTCRLSCQKCYGTACWAQYRRSMCAGTLLSCHSPGATHREPIAKIAECHADIIIKSDVAVSRGS